MEIRLPAQKNSSHSVLANMTRDSIVFALRAFIDPTIQEAVEEQDSLVVSDESIFPGAREAFADFSAQEHYLGVMSELKSFLKSGTYDRAERLRHSVFSLPQAQQELEMKLHYRRWPKEVVKLSRVKNRTRVLYRNPNEAQPMSIAETHDSQSGDLKTAVRETEVILKRLDGTGWDFYVFDSRGNRTVKSTFYNKAGHDVQAHSPYTCMTCHYDGANRQFQRSPLSFSGRNVLK